jgi:hypothetical protein
MDVFTALSGIPGIGPFLPYVPLVVFVSSILATAMPAPQPAAGWLYVVIYRVVNLSASNFGHAKNEGLK